MPPIFLHFPLPMAVSFAVLLSTSLLPFTVRGETLPVVGEIALTQGFLIAPGDQGKMDLTAIQVAAQYKLLGALQVGIGIGFGNNNRSSGNFEMQLRPTVLIFPQELDYFGRLTFGIDRIVGGKMNPMIGISAGTTAKFLTPNDPLTLFYELGMTTHQDPWRGRGRDMMHYFVELRVGTFIEF